MLLLLDSLLLLELLFGNPSLFLYAIFLTLLLLALLFGVLCLALLLLVLELALLIFLFLPTALILVGRPLLVGGDPIIY